jgi:excinuclease UvrABC ATPase subunit
VTTTIEGLRKKGFARLLVDGRAISLDDVDVAALPDRATLKVVVDRVQLGDEDLRQRLTDSIETAYLEGEAQRGLSNSSRKSEEVSKSRVTLFSERSSAGLAGSLYEDPQPRLFSSTIRSVPVRPAMASATSSSSTWRWWCPIPRNRSLWALSSRGASRTIERSWLI